MVRDDEAVAQVQGAYADFQRGDIATLLSRCDDGIEWETPGGGTAIPYAGKVHGKSGVAGFFQSLASTVDFHDFQPREYISDGDTVVCLGSFDATVRATGIRVAEEFAMAFRLRGGKIAAFREYSDSRALADAFAAPPKR
jgi:ketosteroid isomerase-like protein